MPYTDKHGRPELITHPSFRTGFASPRIEPSDGDDEAAAQDGAGEPDPPGGVHRAASAAAPRAGRGARR